MYALDWEPEMEAKPLFYDVYDTEVYEGDDYYEINGEVIAYDNIDKWLREYRKEAVKRVREDY